MHVLFKDEPVSMMLQRWEKLEKDLYNKKKDSFDVSKIPDIYDQLKYDIMHNSHVDLPEVGVCICLRSFLLSQQFSLLACILTSIKSA